jgi:hypothetical protein
MSVSQHRHAVNPSSNQKKRISQMPDGQRQDPSPIDTFAEEGAGIAAKE